MTQNAIELIQAVVADHQPAVAGTGVLDAHRCAEFFRQLLLKSLNVGINCHRCAASGGFGRFDHASYQALGLA